MLVSISTLGTGVLAAGVLVTGFLSTAVNNTVSYLKLHEDNRRVVISSTDRAARWVWVFIVDGIMVFIVYANRGLYQTDFA